MIGLAVVIGKAGRQDTVNFSKVCWRQNDVRGAGISAQVSPAAGAGYRDQLVAFGQNPGDCSGESGQATSGAEAAELVYFQRIGGKVRFCETRICVSNSVIWLRQSRIAQQVAGEQREGGKVTPRVLRAWFRLSSDCCGQKRIFVRYRDAGDRMGAAQSVGGPLRTCRNRRFWPLRSGGTGCR